jgi:hypothetical protein
MKVTEGCTCATEGWPCPDCQQRFYTRAYQIRSPYSADRWHLLLLLGFVVFMFPEEAHVIMGSMLAVFWLLTVVLPRRRAARRTRA